MNIGLTGATGFLGRRILDIALRRGHEIIAFTRHPERGIPGCTMRAFSLETPPDISGCEALIHLAGEPVAGLWTPAKKRRIVETRVQGTRRVVEAIAAATQKPEVLVNGSAIGFYGSRGEEELTENLPPGTGYLADTVQAWEAEASRATDARVVLLRTSLVLGREAGALPLMAMPFRFGLGAQMGDGRQWMPWIHIEDIARLALFAVENLDIRGPMNASAPWPVRNADFTHMLARQLHRPAFFRAPAFVLRTLLGDLSHELLDSKRVLPAVACEHGFGFQFSELEPALKDLLG
ncbi:MAG: TIGR01777 family oxidoreductase [Chthoniobacter sp.]|uniref:TIGR01777 family oxidoreductase n=1 Tax=Chthoniobacter sp. TaxID=2510640 RepID=UPI0032ADBFBB